MLHIADADSAENNSGSKNIVVYPVAFAVPNGKGDAPKLSGAIAEIRAFVPVHFCRPNSGDKEVVTQEFFCNVELNPAFEWTTMETGFPVVALGRQVRYAPLNLPTDRSYLAKVFQPQSSSTEKNPYPLVLAFVPAAADWRKKKLDDCVLE